MKGESKMEERRGEGQDGYEEGKHDGRELGQDGGAGAGRMEVKEEGSI